MPAAIDDALTRLQRLLEERDQTALGPSDSAVLLALARVVVAHVRRELAREAARAG